MLACSPDPGRFAPQPRVPERGNQAGGGFCWGASGSARLQAGSLALGAESAREAGGEWDGEGGGMSREWQVEPRLFH